MISQKHIENGHWRHPREVLTSRTGVHIRYASFAVQQSRMLRSVASQNATGLVDRSLVVGYAHDDVSEYESIDDRTTAWHVRLGTHHSSRLTRLLFGRSIRITNLLLWWVKVLIALRHHRLAYIQCHGLAALPAAVALRYATGTPVLYDAHELETERTGWTVWMCRIAKFVERYCIARVDHTIVVNDSIRDWYKASYPEATISTIRNVPIRATQPPAPSRRLRDALHIADSDLVFLYIGVIDESRCTQIMLEAFEGLHPDRHLVFLGMGPQESLVRAAMNRCPNIHFHPQIPFRQVVDFASGADAGMVLFRPDSMSYEFSLPNKFFQCMAAGLPVLANSMPETNRFIRESGRGWILSELDAQQLRQTVSAVTRQEILAMKAKPYEVPCWEDEAKLLVEITAEVMGTNIAPPRHGTGTSSPTPMSCRNDC